MASGRPLVPLTLSWEHREQLQSWSRRAKTAQALAMRSRIVLLAADGLSNTEIARRQGCSLPTAGKWRQRFLDRGLDGLLDEPRPGTPRKLSDRHVERVLTRTLESQPEAATHWSTRDMAKACGLSQSTISRIWRAFSLAPHRAETFKLSRDPLFIDKVRDIVGLYLDPPDRALVLCVDEKSQIQALDRTAPILPLRPGVPERQTHDYKRNGTTSVFAAFNILNGKVIGSCLPRHRGKEFIKFLNQLEKEVPEDLDVHLILDNYSTHKSAAVQRWLKPRKRRRFHFHFTPTSSSWLNQVERWFGLITDRMIRRGTFHSVAELEQAIYTWLARVH